MKPNLNWSQVCTLFPGRSSADPLEMDGKLVNYSEVRRTRGLPLLEMSEEGRFCYYTLTPSPHPGPRAPAQDKRKEKKRKEKKKDGKGKRLLVYND